MNDAAKPLRRHGKYVQPPFGSITKPIPESELRETAATVVDGGVMRLQTGLPAELYQRIGQGALLVRGKLPNPESVATLGRLIQELLEQRRRS